MPIVSEWKIENSKQYQWNGKEWIEMHIVEHYDTKKKIGNRWWLQIEPFNSNQKKII